jgi:TATA-binding protein-associated factor Taf7
MAASEGSEEEVETTEETASAEAELTDDEPVVELTESEAADAAQEEEAAEDPELVALKEEISAMEKTLKERRVQVALTADTADDFTSGGYARKVAEMEQMRKNKRVSIVPYETGM